eukprot:Phypoly_transcript_02049.p1 GENE.Phypoly_transcript_02049~~Phypoly_transcript_02049.p1  ORF type:complete len:942 (+),score=158.82 Phypoly_transcript_02049:112-2937(+)
MSNNDAIIVVDPHAHDETAPPDSSTLLSGTSEKVGESSPPHPSILAPPDKEKETGPKKRARFSDEVEEKEFHPQESVMPENAEPDDWNWFTSLRSRIEQSNQGLMSKISKSNKAIETKIGQSNKLIEEKFYEGLGAVASAPSRAADSIREKHNHRVEMKEHHQSEHWKHERKLLTKFESLDYTTIYNKSYRTELYQRFFDVTGDYEWLRWILSFFIAVLIGFIAWISKAAITNLTEGKFWVVEQANEYSLVLGFFVYFLSNIAIAALGSIIAVYYEPTSAGSGIPEVKAYLNGTKVPRFLRMRTLFGKVTSMICANSSGLQVGAEGPMIHVGAIVGNGVSQMQSKELGFKIPGMRHFRNDRDKRDFITSGAGAGVAAAFGAPLGGTLFSLEEVSSFWSTLLTWRTFFTCMIAVFITKLFSQIQAGKKDIGGLMIFDVGSGGGSQTYQVWEIVPFLVIGVLGGLLGGAFTALNLWIGRIRVAKINKKNQWRVAEVVAIAAVSSCLQFLLPFLSDCAPLPEGADEADFTRHYCGENQYNELASILFTSNEKTIKNLFTFGQPMIINLLPIFSFFVFYCLGAAYTAGCGISSGMFVPMVVIGAAYGRVVGVLLFYLYRDIEPGIYAIMGSAAFMAGVSRLTVSLSVIIIEITNDLPTLLPIMIVVMVAKIVADFIIHPLFDMQIEMKHIPYLEPNPVKEMKILMSKHIMARPPKYVSEKDTIGNILNILKNTTHNGFPVVNNSRDRFLKGIILRPQLLVLLDRLSRIWVSRSEMVYSHQEYMTKLAWNLPKLQDILDAYEEEDYAREVDLSPYINITVYSVNEEFAVSEAYTMFRTMGLRHLIVVNERNKVKGMITKKDLLEHSCLEKYKELKRLKKMNIDLPEDLDMDSTPGTPAEPLHSSSSIAEAIRKRVSPHGTPAPRSPLSNSQVIYAIDPPTVEKEGP